VEFVKKWEILMGKKLLKLKNLKKGQTANGSCFFGGKKFRDFVGILSLMVNAY